ncbi:hypothetical protein PEPNEM18_00977 [Aedoeadaptatus nemausensis]|uniref:Histidine kinase/HSP90-like ATPase domain-containing protein n=1 Tax=Aedoeadaptatus nemausensis TaxID=2582829 RepID=A0A6V6Y3P1_9FIRM|nr:ATP-binding protein [Peptoniphilus nemausensis]CAC9931409.1 hypothetical protein PEPNEM18_00977 [Peptoniphilus nemausensis]
MNRGNLIEGSVPSDMFLLKEFIADAMGEVASYVTDRDLLFDIRLIIDELLLNGADHGNEWDREKQVYLRMDFISDGVRIVVQDEGRGIQYFPEGDPCTMDCCSGRGLFLVESLCRSVAYEGNTIECYLELPY